MHREILHCLLVYSSLLKAVILLIEDRLINYGYIHEWVIRKSILHFFHVKILLYSSTSLTD